MGCPHACVERTRSVLVEIGTPEEMKQRKWIPQFSTNVSMEVSSDLSKRDHNVLPLASPDHRVVAWEVRRRDVPAPVTQQGAKWVASSDALGLFGNTLVERLLARPQREMDLILKALEHRNGSVVDSCPPISAAFLCNQASYILGTSEDAWSSAYYITEYMSKAKESVGTSLAVIAHAAKRIREHPSVAEDTGTVHRNGKHFPTAAVNRAAGLSEVADVQVGAYFLGVGQFQQTTDTQ